MAHGNAEIRVPHQYRTGCLSFDLYGTDGKAFQCCIDVEIYLMGTFFETFNRKVGLAAFCRAEQATIIGCTHLQVRPRIHYSHSPWEIAGSISRHAQRIIARDLVSARILVFPGRQGDGCCNILHNQARYGRRAVCHHKQRAKVLMEKPDIIRDYDDARYRRQRNASSIPFRYFRLHQEPLEAEIIGQFRRIVHLRQ